MKAFLLSIVISTIIFGISKAAPADSTPVMHHLIGISASSITGFGIAYRVNFDNEFYLKPVVGVYYNENNTTSSNTLFSMGLELQRNFIRTDNSRLYAFVGTSYWYDKDIDSYSIGSYSSQSETSDETSNIGIGIGIELVVWQHFSANFDLGFQYTAMTYTSFQSSTLSGIEYYDKASSRTGMGGGISFGYQF